MCVLNRTLFFICGLEFLSISWITWVLRIKTKYFQSIPIFPFSNYVKALLPFYHRHAPTVSLDYLTLRNNTALEIKQSELKIHPRTRYQGSAIGHRIGRFA